MSAAGHEVGVVLAVAVGVVKGNSLGIFEQLFLRGRDFHIQRIQPVLADHRPLCGLIVHIVKAVNHANASIVNPCSLTVFFIAADNSLVVGHQRVDNISKIYQHIVIQCPRQTRGIVGTGAIQ